MLLQVRPEGHPQGTWHEQSSSNTTLKQFFSAAEDRRRPVQGLLLLGIRDRGALHHRQVGIVQERGQGEHDYSTE